MNTMPRLVGQEAEYPAPGPDMEPPSDEDLYDVDVNPDVDDPDVADDSSAPPFTGEDVEDIGDERRPHLACKLAVEELGRFAPAAALGALGEVLSKPIHAALEGI